MIYIFGGVAVTTIRLVVVIIDQGHAEADNSQQRDGLDQLNT